MNQPPLAFWSISAAEMLQQLGATGEGLPDEEARERLARYGANLLKPQARSNALTLLLGQFKSPIVLLLLFATGLSFFLHDPVNAFIILAIVLASGLLGFWQEHSATRAVEKLLAMVQVKTTALRDGKPKDIPVEQIVPGDIVILNAGDLVPGDCLVDESKDLFVDEATLTGETYPAEKSVGVLAAETPLAKRTNALWLPEHLAAMASFSLATGLRAANVTGLQWSQVDLVRRVAWVHPDQAKSRRAIPVPLHTGAVLIVRQRLGTHPTHVFSYRGKPITQVSTKAWYAALETAGIEDFRWHDLRHTWASWHVQAGTPLFALQEMGGWSSAEMVRRYAHLAADHLAPYAEKLCRPLTVVPETLGTNWSQPTK